MSLAASCAPEALGCSTARTARREHSERKLEMNRCHRICGSRGEMADRADRADGIAGTCGAAGPNLSSPLSELPETERLEF